MDYRQIKLKDESGIMLIYGDTRHRAYNIAQDLMKQDFSDQISKTTKIMAVPLGPFENLYQLTDEDLKRFGLQRIKNEDSKN